MTDRRMNESRTFREWEEEQLGFDDYTNANEFDHANDWEPPSRPSTPDEVPDDILDDVNTYFSQQPDFDFDEEEEEAEEEESEQSGNGNIDVDIKNMYTSKFLGKEMWKECVWKHRFQLLFKKEMKTLLPENYRAYALALLDFCSQLPMASEPNVKVGFDILSKKFDTPLFIHPQPLYKFTPNFLKREVESKLQSSREMDPIDEEVEVLITFVKPTDGSGRPKAIWVYDKTKTTKRNHGSISRNNVSEYCLGVAIGRGIALLQLKKQPENVELKRLTQRWERLSDEFPLRSPDCREEAKNILERSGITKKGDYTLEDVRAVQAQYQGVYQIIVINDDFDPEPLYSGQYVNRVDKIALYLTKKPNRHFSLIFSLSAFLDCRFYCTLCNVKEGSEKLHYTCPLKCVKCLDDKCERGGNADISCKDCTVNFTSSACYERHMKKGKLNGKSRCENTKTCPNCMVVYYTDRGIAHECGLGYCTACKTTRKKGHKHSLAIRKEPKEISNKRVFFDFECVQKWDEETECEKHTVVLACALRCCPSCRHVVPQSREEALTLTCENCSFGETRYHEFGCVDKDKRDVNVLEEFCDWLFGSHHKGFSAICHNLKGYDGQLLLQYLLQPEKSKVELILNGRKVNMIKNKSMRVLDSYNFIPFALRLFSKAFDIPSLVKGEFPFDFIKEENYDYVGPVPDKSFYGYTSRNSKDRKLFDNWYTERVNNGLPFDFSVEIKRYCWADVTLLAASMSKFEEQFYSRTRVTLFEETVTSASAALLTFQRNFVKEGEMILDSDVSSRRVRQSTIAKRYLAYLSTKENLFIKSANNSLEQQIGKYFVDGYIAPCEKYPRGLAIEFQGCYWHAHNCSYSATQIVRGCDRAIDIWRRDADRLAEIRKECDVRVYYECLVKAEADSNPTLAKMLQLNMKNGPVDGRECLYGGRTEVLALHGHADEDHELHYLDFTSLYPFVMKTCPYPLGDSTTINGDKFCCPMTRPGELEAVCKGYVSCKVLPPRQLYLPVLPHRGEKLLFTLCRSCGEEKSESCEHDEEERCLYGTWTSSELELALTKGYSILECYGGIHWDRWTDKIFAEYINSFLKLKQEASGFPHWVKSQEDKEKYVKQYFVKEGIELNIDNIREDQVLRTIAKLLLNSLWGKFGQRADVNKTHVVRTESELMRLMNNPGLEITAINVHNEHTLTVQTRAVDGALQPLPTSCMQYAVFTTSHARITLYKALDQIPDMTKNLLYTDTDSMIFRSRRVAGNPLKHLMGEYLGELTSEISRGAEMAEFITIGPKSYAYKERKDGQDTVKVKAKGFPLTGEAESLITYGNMEKMVQARLQRCDNEPETEIPSVSVKYRTIVRDSKHNLLNRSLLKKFSFTFDKRVVLSDGSTIPYGYSQ